MTALKEHAKWYFLVALILANAVIWYALALGGGKGVLTVAFLDVGQGDAIYIEAPNGNQILIDGGPGKGMLRELAKVTPFYDRSIDVVIATHPDKDHIGGLPELLTRYEVGVIMRSGAVNDTGVFQSLNEIIQRKNVEELLARRGMRVQLGGGAYLDILFPDRDATDFEPNDASVITRLVYGETKFLFTGDAPKDIEEYIARLDRSLLKSDVLKVGHHGSKTSTGALFLGAVLPSIGIISAEENSRYGHPHQEVLDILAEFNIETIATSEAGTIVFESDGKKIWRR